MSDIALRDAGPSQTTQQASPGSKKPEPLLKKIGIPLAALIFAALMAMPTPDGLGYAGQKALAIFCAALTLWVAGSIPIYLTSMLAIITLVLTGTVKERVAFTTGRWPNPSTSLSCSNASARCSGCNGSPYLQLNRPLKRCRAIQPASLRPMPANCSNCAVSAMPAALEQSSRGSRLTRPSMPLSKPREGICVNSTSSAWRPCWRL